MERRTAKDVESWGGGRGGQGRRRRAQGGQHRGAAQHDLDLAYARKVPNLVREESVQALAGTPQLEE